MANTSDYTISKIYQGGTSSLTPNYGNVFSKYNITAGSLGITTDPRTANVLKEVTGKLSSGVKQIEVTMISPDMFDQVPKQHLEEVRRLSELTGIDISVHGPVIDTTGISQQGFSELNREASEKKMTFAVERSHELNPNGTLPVTFHSAEGIPGTEVEITPEGRKIKKLIVVNRESGKLAPMEEELKFYPERDKLKPEAKEMLEQGILKPQEINKDPEKYFTQTSLKKGEIMTPKDNLRTLNHTEWDNSISQIIFNKERADEILQKNAVQIQHLEEAYASGRLKKPEDFTASQLAAHNHVKNAETYLEDVGQHVNALFHKAYKYGDERQRKELQKMSDEYIKTTKKIPGILGNSQAMQDLLLNLKSQNVTPNMYIPVEDFAVEQSSKTFGNVAFNSYKKFGDKSPIVSIENPPAGFAISTGEDLKKLIVASREKFVERAVKPKNQGGMNISEDEAKRQAEKIIGATWDVGHINMLRKHGFEEKHLVEETGKIAPFVKHVHLSDNFGFEHTELPMGMGNVPMAKIMEKLGKKGFEAKKIIEAGHWWQHFQTSPVVEVMENLGSPIYATGTGPFWNQTVGLYQGYMGGYGMMLPAGNYQTFGAGFSQLPSELGGQRGGAQGSRMSGRGME